VFDVAHGQRDWSNLGAEENVHGMDDMAELAARLGSPDLFNREGNVLFLDTFEHGLKPWNFVGAGVDADAIASNEWSRYGGYSCKLISGFADGGNMLAQRIFPYPILSKYGVEYAFNVESGVTQLDTVLNHYDGTTKHNYSFRIQFSANRLIIWEAGGVPVIFKTSLPLSTASYANHILKMVVDTVNDKWLRIILNDTEYDLTAYASSDSASAVDPVMDVSISAYSGAASNAAVYIDDLIITFNEP
jgi:hypothetical protein